EERAEVLTLAPGSRGWVTPSVQQWNGMSSASASAVGGGIDYAALAAANARANALALNGLSIVVDGHTFGTLVVDSVANYGGAGHGGRRVRAGGLGLAALPVAPAGHLGVVSAQPADGGGASVAAGVRPGLRGPQRVLFAAWAEQRIVRYFQDGPESDGWLWVG